jgi:hypothetical protein
MRYDIRAKVREYKDNKTGEVKNVYATIGSAWVGDETNSISLDTIPVNWSGKAFLNEPYEKRSDEPMTQAQALNDGKDVVIEDIDDKPIDLSSIPF